MHLQKAIKCSCTLKKELLNISLAVATLSRSTYAANLAAMPKLYVNTAVFQASEKMATPSPFNNTVHDLLCTCPGT
jgi:hypothetical protein